jgi:hypothetical protein
MKIENNKIKQNLKLYQNINNIWNDEKIEYNSKLSPLKNLKPNLLLNNYNNSKNTRLKINPNFDNTTQNKNDKKSIFEDNYFLDKYKKKKAKNTSPTNKEIHNSNNNNFYLNHIFLGFDSSKTEVYKPLLVNTQKFRDNDISKIPYVEDKNTYNKLNLGYENYIGNLNDKAVNELLIQQKKLNYNSNNNNQKIIQKNIYKDHTYDDDSLSKIMHIEPIITNFNGKVLESNVVYNNKNLKNKLNISYTQDNILKSDTNNKIVLPSLTINPYPFFQHKKISFNQIDENNTSVLTDRYSPENEDNQNNKHKKGLDIFSTEKKNIENS